MSVAALPWSAGTPHRIRVLVDFLERRYDLWVKPAGQPERRLLAAAPLPSAVKTADDLDTFAWSGSPATAASALAVGEYATPFSAKINFQTSGSAGYPGCLPDTGAAYGDRGNGHAYGWIEGANAALARDRNSANSPDERHDTLNQMQYNNPPTEIHTWEIAVPRGSYDVRLVCGDPDYTDSYYHVLAEGITLVQGNAQGSGRRFFDQSARIVVEDGRLTLTNGPGAYRNKVCFIEIRSTGDRPYPFETYQSWAAARFAGGAADPAAAAGADPDRNGLPNALEYATGGDPAASAAEGSVTAFALAEAGFAEFRFHRSAQALDAGYGVWETADLVHWDLLWSSEEDADFSSPLVVPPGSATDEWVTLQFPLDPGRPRQFFRLQVALP